MILAVSNTTLLSNFAHVGRSDLPPLAFAGLAIPSAVLEELRAGVRLGFLPRLDWSSLPVIEPGEIELERVKRSKPALDRGEVACLALALGHGAVAVTDDRDARKVAQTLELRVSGTLGALISRVCQEYLTLGDADGRLARMIEAGYRSPGPALEPYLDL